MARTPRAKTSGVPVIETELLHATDQDFAWMIEGAGVHPTRGLSLPPQGVDEVAVLRMLREMTRALLATHGRGSWLVVSSDEVAGLCSYLRPPDQEGVVEIGFGIAPVRRSLGHATRAVAKLLRAAQADPGIQVLTAQTAKANIGSQRVLEKNGFVPTGTAIHPEDGEVICWRHGLEVPAS